MTTVPDLYFAYGSNLNHEQMGWRCPDSEFVGSFWLRGWELEMRCHANIRPQRRARVPGALWKITPHDLQALDAYEGLGSYYRRRAWQQDGQRFFFYEMIDLWQGQPSQGYLQGILHGYQHCGLDPRYLLQSLDAHAHV